MARLRASDFHPQVMAMFDQYVHGELSRRDFLDRAAPLAIGGVSAASLLADYAQAQQVPENDSRIETSHVDYPSPNGHGTVNAYVARPKGKSGKLPGVLVIHENRGLNPYMADVVRRFGAAGYLAFGPDGLTPYGGYPGTDDEGREMQSKLDGAKLFQDFQAAAEFLQKHPDCTGKVGAIGFCYGAGVCNGVAARMPTLAAAVPFYGRQAPTEDVPNIRAPLQLHYAELDERVNAGWPEYEKALKANNKQYEVYFYPAVNHGFHNYSTPRFDEPAAKLAEDRAMAFFKKHLS